MSNPPSFILRPATAEDARAINTLVRKAGINPTGLKWPRFVVAASPDGIIACGQIKPHTDGSQELASIAVTPSWQGKGVARTIIEHLLAHHSGELHLICRAPLGPFYEKFGFQALSEKDMPPYFRRIKRLAKVAEFVAKEELMLIMKRPANH